MRTISQPAADQPLDLVDGRRACRACRSSSSTARGSGSSPPTPTSPTRTSRVAPAARRRRARGVGAAHAAQPLRDQRVEALERRRRACAGSLPPACAKSGRPPPLPPTTRRDLAHQVAGAEALRRGRASRRARATRGPPRSPRAARSPLPSWLRSSSTMRAQLLAVDAVDARREHASRRRSRSACDARSPEAAPRCCGAQPLDLALRLAPLLEQLLDALGQLADRRAQQLRRRARACAPARAAARARRRRSAPRCAARRTRSPDSETILSRPMSPVARACVPPHSSVENVAEGDHAHAVAVLLLEDRDGAGRDRVAVAPSRARSRARSPRSSRSRGPRSRRAASRVERRVVGEVEAQAVRARPASPSASPAGRAPRAAPRAAGACPSGCARSPRAALGVDRELARAASTWISPLHDACRGARRARPPGRCVSSTSTRPRRRLDHAAVAHLAAALGVEGRLVDHHLDLVARARRCDGWRRPTSSARDPRARRERVVAAEARLRGRPRAARRPRPTRASPLPFQAARARSRCVSIAASKPAWSSVEAAGRAGCPR